MQGRITTQEIIKDYDRIYSTSGLRANTAYYRWIIGLLRPQPKTRMLDVSCGEGILLREIVRLKRNIRTYGLDISNIAVGIARKNTPESKILLADGQRLPFADNLFDYVTCLGSLEHYLDLGIRELSRVAKNDAKFCLVLPNSFDIDLILEVLKTGKSPPQDFQIIERFATKQEWINLLHKNGLNVESTYASNLWPELFQEGTHKVKSLPKYFKRLLIRYFCPVNLAREFVFICTKEK
jgi:ubiquinone/menaquinone biosynthesis C-methylase UbiE